MKQVKDNSGNVLEGVYRHDSGALVVHDPTKYKRYEIQKSAFAQSQKQIEDLTKELLEMKNIIGKILEGRT